MRWTLDEYQETIRPLDVECIGSFLGITKKTLHKCLKCKAEFGAIPDNVFRSKTKCPMCSSVRMHLNTELYNGLIAARKIKLVGKFVGQTVKTKHVCLACRYHWSPLPDNVLSGSGCPACSKDQANSGWKHRTKLRIGKRVVNVQGYEPQAVDYLSQCGCNVEKLLFNTHEGKPTFNYTRRGKQHLYIPDFYYAPKQRVIEVKSVWTLFQDRATFLRNCAKARAVLAAGYEFCLLVMSEVGNRLTLPRNWYEYRYEDLQELVTCR